MRREPPVQRQRVRGFQCQIGRDRSGSERDRMEVPHPPGGFVRVNRFKRAAQFFVDAVKVAEMGLGVPVGW